MRSRTRDRYILLLDDNADIVEHYKHEIEKVRRFHVTTAFEGRRAQVLAQARLFDTVVIDAKLDFKGLEFGGLRLADELRPRYGSSSLVVVSRYITSELMDLHGADYEFIEKHDGRAGRSFGAELRETIDRLCRDQYAFVAMPFEEKYNALYRIAIKPAVTDAGLRCIRIDEVPHNRRIHDVIYDGVHKSKLVIFVADGANPNAYYEAGFADAMRKEVVIVAEHLEVLRFDVQTRHTITYGHDEAKLRALLTKRIRDIRRYSPPGL